MPENDKTKETNIVVNGRQRTWSEKEISFEQLLPLAFDPVPEGPNFIFTVTYRRGHGDKPEGSLTAGTTAKVKEDMVFNVTATDKS